MFKIITNTPDKKGKVFIVFLVVLFLFLIHVPYISNGFAWLDHGDIESKRTIVSGLGWLNVLLNRFGETSFYRPLVTIVNTIDYHFYQLWAPGYHLTNVILHMLVVIAAPLFISSFLFLSFWEKILIMLIVGIHPISFLPVGAISYRQELFFALFTYLTVYFHSLDRRGIGERWGIKVIRVTCFIFAVFSKETAIVIIPLLILLWEVSRGNIVCHPEPASPAGRLVSGSRQKEMLKRVQHDKRIILYGLIILLYFLVRRIAVPEWWKPSFYPMTMEQAIGTRLMVVGELLLNLIAPTVPSLSDATEIVSLLHPGSFLTAVILLILLIIAWSGRPSFAKASEGKENQGYEKWFVVLSLFFILLLPAFNLVPLPRFSSPHYGYVTLPVVAGLFVLLARLVSNLRYLGKGMIFLWIVVGSLHTYQAGFRFQNDETLFLPEVMKDDRFLEGHQYLGDFYFKKNQFERAQKHYQKALIVDKNYIAYVDRSSVVINLAGVYVQQENYEDADQLLIEAQQDAFGSNLETILYNRALIAYKRKDYLKAVELLYKSGQWKRPEPWLMLADSLKKLGKVDKAVDVLKKNIAPLLSVEKFNQVIEELFK